MNCPSCGAPIRPEPDTEGFKCDYCHGVFFPSEQDDGVTVFAEAAAPDQSQVCPLCNLALVQAAIAKIPVLYCTGCHGMLLPMQVLPSIIDELRTGQSSRLVQTPPDQEDLKRSIQCPQCHRRMDTHFYAGPGNVIIDSCGDCLLIWLDRSELTRIVHAPDESYAGESDWS